MFVDEYRRPTLLKISALSIIIWTKWVSEQIKPDQLVPLSFEQQMKVKTR